jgi:hypothetical protein
MRAWGRPFLAVSVPQPRTGGSRGNGTGLKTWSNGVEFRLTSKHIGGMDRAPARLRIAAAAFAASLWLSLPALAQAPAPQFPTGSRLGLVPPPGMTVSRQVQGFEDTANNAFIRLIELPDNAFSEIEKTLTADLLKKQGMILEKRDSLKLPGGKAILLSVRQNTPGGTIRKWMMVGPLPGRTAMVSFEFPVALKAYPEGAIRTALASVVARDAIPQEEQLALAPFRIGELAGFRVVGVIPGRAVQLTDGPKDAIDTIDQPHLIAGVLPGGAPRPEERDSFARAALSGLPPMKDVRITGSESLRIGGSQGHELRAEGKDAKSGADVQVVQWLRFGGGAHLRIVGIGPKEDWTKTFMRFRAVRDGIEPR